MKIDIDNYPADIASVAKKISASAPPSKREAIAIEIAGALMGERGRLQFRRPDIYDDALRIEGDMRRLGQEGKNLVRVGQKNELGVGICHALQIADVLEYLTGGPRVSY